MEEPTCSTFPDVPLSSSEIANVDFDITETQEIKIAEEPLPVSITLLHEPTKITSNPSSSNKHQHQVIFCSRLSWKYLKKHPKIIKLNTGCPTAAAFNFIINRLQPKDGEIHYFKGNEMETAKRYQFSPSKLLCHKELERKRQLRLDDEVLFLLMRIYLDSSTEYLAF